MCEAAGAAAITIHARTRSQMYSGRTDWSVIRAVKQAAAIPVYGNGDVVDALSARQMFEQTAVDGLMIGRAALGNPWIFAQISQALSSSSVITMPDIDERIDVVLAHWHGLQALIGEHKALLEMRRHLAHYLRGFPCATRLRKMVMNAQDEQSFLNVLEEWRFC